MSVEGLIEAVSAAIGAAAIVGGTMRRYWTTREVRQEVAFRQAVQQIVDTSVTIVLHRQENFEKRQGRHLDRQDRAIADLRARIDQLGRQRDN